MIRRILLILIVLAVNTPQVHSQVNEFSNINTSVGAAALVYLGDLTPYQYGDAAKARPGVQLTTMMPLTQKLGIRAALLAGSLDGDDKRYDGWRRLRSFSFKSNIVELSVLAQWEFAGQSWDNTTGTGKYNSRSYKRISPYVFAGIGYLYNRVTRNMTGIDSVYFQGDIAWDNYYEEAGTVYKSGMIVLPAGIGTHILLGNNVRMYVEYCYHTIFNDHLDGFATAVVSSKPDAYQSFTIGLDFRFLKYGSHRRSEVCNLNLQ